MDAIQIARQLGKAIQEDERYISWREAQRKNDSDTELQALIGKFNAHRDALNAETQKPEKDQDKIREVDSRLKEVYASIFQNENMLGYNDAREEMNKLLQFINQIVVGSAEGQNPDLIQPQESCAGECGGCSGCS